MEPSVAPSSGEFRGRPMTPKTQPERPRLIEVKPAGANQDLKQRSPSPGLVANARLGDTPNDNNHVEITPVDSPGQHFIKKDPLRLSSANGSRPATPLRSPLVDTPKVAAAVEKEEDEGEEKKKKEEEAVTARNEKKSEEGEVEKKALLPDGTIACPFAEFGCSTVGERPTVQKHVRDDRFLHLSQLCDAVLRLQSTVREQLAAASTPLEIDDSLARRAAANEKLYSCQLIWRIDDYAKHFSAARNGKTALIFSRPFLSHCNGYKLVAMLAPWGDGEALRECVSVFVSLVRSDFDGMLPWPFAAPVTFTLLSQKENIEHHSMTLTPRPLPENAPFLGRPRADRNPAFGLQRFIRVDTMREGRGYVEHDVAFLKIEVDIHSINGI